MTDGHEKLQFSLRTMFIIVAISGLLIFAISLLGEMAEFIAVVALFATPVMFLFGAACFLSRSLRKTAAIACVLSTLIWAVYLSAWLLFDILYAPSEAATTGTAIALALNVIAFFYPFYVVIDVLFVLAIVGTLRLGLKLWFPHNQI
jgi:hypothetical protein